MRVAAFFRRFHWREFMAAVPYERWREWEQFFGLEPAGGAHEDLRWGMLLALLANKDRTKGPPAKPEDFFPGLAQADGPGPHELTEQDVIERNLRWRAAAVASGGMVIESGGGEI